MRILDVENFTKQFEIHQLGRKIEVLGELNFSLDEGQFLLVSGSNGAGKSTLLRCLYRTYRPTQGTALFHSRYGLVDLAQVADIDITLLRREEIGFVTQFLRPRPRVTAVESGGRAVTGVGDIVRGSDAHRRRLAGYVWPETGTMESVSHHLFRRRAAEGESGTSVDRAAPAVVPR